MKCVKRRLTKRIDKTYNDKFYKTNKKLMDILSEGEQWGHKPANQEYRKEYIDRGSRLSYVHLLVNVKYAFMKSDFIWVCHELQDILHYEDIFQNRIKYNVLDLIEEYIGEK